MNRPFLDDFKNTIALAEHKLRKLSDAQSETPRAPGKWCPKEIVGHLIDSASNNHQRFIRAQFKEDLIFDGYRQDDWVRVQNYREESWEHVITAWVSLNRHLVHVIEQIPDSVLKQNRVHHNLDERAFKPVPRNESVTLEYFIVDYLDHMKHHLRQIFPDM